MGVNSLPKTVTRQRRGCDLNPGPSALESSTLTTTTRLASHPTLSVFDVRLQCGARVVAVLCMCRCDGYAVVVRVPAYCR